VICGRHARIRAYAHALRLKTCFNVRSRIMTCVRNMSSLDKWRNDVKSQGMSKNDAAFVHMEIPKFRSYYMKIIRLVLKSSRNHGTEYHFGGAGVFMNIRF
jgi:hypothetical protein